MTALDAERALLGACLAGSPDAAAAVPSLTLGDLADPRHALVLEAMTSLQARGAGLDPVLVLHELRNLGHVQRWTDGDGVGPFMHALLLAAGPGPSAPFHAEVVREAAARRRVQVAAGRLEQAAQSGSLDVLAELVTSELKQVRAALARVAAS